MKSLINLNKGHDNNLQRLLPTWKAQ